MSEDLVKRLRDHIAVSFDDRGHVFENELLCDQAADRIEELEAKLKKLERWQAAAFIAHGNLDLDIEANPEALAELTGGKDE